MKSGEITRIDTQKSHGCRAWTLVFLICLFSSAGNLWAAELNIRQNQLPVTLGQYLDYFEDSSEQLSIDDILAGEFDWQRSTQSIPTLGMSTSAFWFYILLTGEGQDVVLSLDSPTIDRVEFYFVRNSEVVASSVVGDTIPASQLTHHYRIPIVPFELAPQGEATQVYFRVTSTGGIEIPITLSTMPLFSQAQQVPLTLIGAFFTFLGLSFSICALLYFYLRDRHYLAYALFFGAIIVQFLSGTGMGRIWFWGETTETNTRLLYISTAFLIMSFCLIGQSLRFEHRYRTSVNLILRFLSFAMLPVSFFFLLLPFDQITPGTLLPIIFLSLLVLLTVSIMAAVTAIQGSRSALYLFLFWLTLLLAALSYLAHSSGIVERGAFTVSIVEILASIAALLLLASLAELIQARNEEFDRARLETKAKGDFLHNVSREFLTPVHLILANSKRLLAAQSSKLDEATKTHIATVIQQSDYLHNLINDLLEMAELESDNFEPEFELLEISHFLAEVKDIILPTAMEKGLEITTDFASANLLVQTDKLRLQHSLLNILTNAIKFTERGSILIGYKAVYFRRRLGLEIFIQDTGRGMSKEFQQRLFQEFAREDEPSEKEPRGTGLGLVIVKRMIERLGGEISFVSASKEGSEFFIRLPLRINTDEISS